MTRKVEGVYFSDYYSIWRESHSPFSKGSPPVPNGTFGRVPVRGRDFLNPPAYRPPPRLRQGFGGQALRKEELRHQ